MGDSFFIPVDPNTFFGSHPFPGRHAPEDQEGLRFGPLCLSCGAPTEHTATLYGGIREGRRKKTWEQTVRLCPHCLQTNARKKSLSLASKGAALLTGMVSASALGALVRPFLSTPSALLLWIVSLLVLFFVFQGIFVWASSAYFATWLRPKDLPPYHHVELFYFLEPRKGDDTEILCLRIDNPDLAQRFHRENPHAIPSQHWNESLERV